MVAFNDLILRRRRDGDGDVHFSVEKRVRKRKGRKGGEKGGERGGKGGEKGGEKGGRGKKGKKSNFNVS